MTLPNKINNIRQIKILFFIERTLSFDALPKPVDIKFLLVKKYNGFFSK